ncbi:MAG TPA: dienelactone hydrolase family protein [Chthoniobacteraceae bacterium]|jgi:dienelactone hydrolase
MNLMRFLLPLAAVSFGLGSLASRAALSEHSVSYQDGDTACEGFVAYDDASKAARPGVLVFHDWMGLTDHTRDVCRQLAQMGYVAFAADMYGKGVRPANAQAAAAEAGKYKADRPMVRRRAEAALAQLKATQLPGGGVQSGKIAAIGYCFGGLCAIELARDGAPLAGVVSFHGALDSPNPADGAKIKAKLLILHGADDPFVKKDDIEAFLSELRAAKVDWQMVYYANAVHAFSEPWAGTDNSKGAAYNAEAARRSWQAMKDFFAEIFNG